MTRTALRVASLALVVAPALLTTASPASAAEPDAGYEQRYRDGRTGFVATAHWTETDDPDDAPRRRVRSGNLRAFQTQRGSADVLGDITDYDCPPDWWPGEPDDEDVGCEVAGYRVLTGTGLSLDVARRSSSATLTGTVTARSGRYPLEPGPVVGQVPVRITWTATSPRMRDRTTYRWTTGTQRIRQTQRTRYRFASLSGRVEAAVLQDGYSQEGVLESFRNRTRVRG